MTIVEPLAPADLGDALHFSPGDLSANRAGELSPAQRERIHTAWRRWLIAAIIAVIAITPLAAAGLAAGSGAFGGEGSIIFTGMGIALTLLNAGIVGTSAQAYLRYRGDTAAGTVLAEDGRVSRVLRVAGRNSAYVIKVTPMDDKSRRTAEIPVSKMVFNALEDGMVYRFYRGRASRALLSAERAD